MPVQRPHPVQRVIQHRTTSRYFMEDGEWTSDPAKAWHFSSVAEAAAQARRFGLGESCALVLKFYGSSPREVRVPLRTEDGMTVPPTASKP